MADKKPKKYNIEVAPNSRIKLMTSVKCDSGFKHDKPDIVEESHCVGRVRTHKTKYTERGVGEARMLMFKGQHGVKITETGPVLEPATDDETVPGEPAPDNYCGYGKHKETPWSEVPDDYLSLIISRAKDKPELVERAEAEKVTRGLSDAE